VRLGGNIIVGMGFTLNNRNQLSEIRNRLGNKKTEIG